ncbi:MAG: M15 family metallopeptidase [Proteobacteria bacterium]|nr:M15 family metallopeptidase [Pseudomonadota bacterium]
MNSLELTGRSRTHVRQYDNPRFALQPEVAEAFREMVNAAAEEGIMVHPFSSFRDFESQLRIWNLKYSGKRPLYAVDGKPMDFTQLTEREIVYGILGWTALPGGSRHHWGTEIDVIDSNAVPENYTVKLLPEETREGGIFFDLHTWLDENMVRFGFFRPYKRFQDGVFPEPWHLSYAPLARKNLEELTVEIIEETIRQSGISGKMMVLEMLSGIYEKYILNIST